MPKTNKVGVLTDDHKICAVKIFEKAFVVMIVIMIMILLCSVTPNDCSAGCPLDAENPYIFLIVWVLKPVRVEFVWLQPQLLDVLELNQHPFKFHFFDNLISLFRTFEKLFIIWWFNSPVKPLLYDLVFDLLVYPVNQVRLKEINLIILYRSNYNLFLIWWTNQVTHRIIVQLKILTFSLFNINF